MTMNYHIAATVLTLSAKSHPIVTAFSNALPLALPSSASSAFFGTKKVEENPTMPPSYTAPGPKFDLSKKSSSSALPTYKLASGHEMPIIAYGTFRSERGVVGPAVLEALKAGYRHLDLAHVYGNEAEIGAALKQAFDEGIVKREDLFITGKLWNR